MAGMAGSFKFTANAFTRELNTLSFPLRAKLGLAQLRLSRCSFPVFSGIHLLFNGFAFPASRHVLIVKAFSRAG